MRTRVPTTGLLVAAALLPTPAAGQGMPFHTPTAPPLPLAESAVRGIYRHAEFGSLLLDGEEVRNEDRLRLGVDAVQLTLPYALAPGTVLAVGAPYLWKTFERAGAERSKAGLGDLFLLLRRDVLARDVVAGNPRLVVFARASVPTGATEEDGAPLPVPLRLGLGTVDLALQAAYSHVRDRFGVHVAAGYAAAVGRRFGVRTGDRVTYDLAVGWRLWPGTYETLKEPTVAAYLELNGTVQQPSAASS